MKNNNNYFDKLELRSSDQRSSEIFKALPIQILNAKTNSRYFSKLLKDVDPNQGTNPSDFSRLPITRKSDLINIQSENPPLGTMITCEPGSLKRIFQSPGPIYDPEGYGVDWWRTARALYAAGFRSRDILHNAFSYHLTPAGFMLETGAAKIGCAVVPAGIGNTELQVQAISDICPSGFSGTPSFLKILIDKANGQNLDISSISKAIVGGEALPEQLRSVIENAGINCQQIYASADLGCIAYESIAKDGLIAEEGLFIEIVNPGTGDPLPQGEVGEVVATSFSLDYPLIRFGTGDLSAVLSGESPCGRTNIRLKGWMGRADQTTKIKGLFVHPKQISEINRRHPEIVRSKLIVESRDKKDVMTLNCEVAENLRLSNNSKFIASLSKTIQAICTVRGEVKLIKVGTLQNNGKIIEDHRSYD